MNSDLPGKYQQGSGLIDLVLLFSIIVFIGLATYNPTVKVDELKRLQDLARGNEQIENELKLFLKNNPTPTINDIRPIKELVESGALLKYVQTYTDGSPENNGSVQAYFTDKEEKERRDNERRELEMRLQNISFMDLTMDDKVAYLFISYPGRYVLISGIVALVVIALFQLFVVVDGYRHGR